MTLTEIIYGILFQPAATLQYLGEKKPLSQGLIVFILVLLFNMIIGRGTELINPVDAPLALPAGFTWMAGFFGAVVSFIVLFFMAGLFSLLSEIIYGKGNGSGLLTCLAFAALPGVLGPPLQYLSVLAGLEWIAVIVALFVGIWVLVLQVMCIREALGLETGQAIIVFLIPLIAIFSITIGMAVVIVANMPIPT